MDIQDEARLAGVLTDYHDARGEHRHVPHDALRRVLDTLPSADATRLDPPIVHRTGQGPIYVNLVRSDADMRWVLWDGSRSISQGQPLDGRIALPELGEGLYRLEVNGADGTVQSSRPVVVAPPRAFQGEFDRVWVLAVQLYSLRSDRNWGIGDFTDLKALIDIASRLGCAGVGLNPLHVLFDDQPADCSPYAPNSRRFLNPIYIDVDQLPEFEGLNAEQREAIAHEKRQEIIDYASVWRWKSAALRAAFERFRADAASARHEQFEEFRRERGLLLTCFACFEVLRKQFGRPWWEWPAEYQAPSDNLIREFASGSAEVAFTEYLQWVAHQQLQSCTDEAKARGLKVGLYLDIAVGVRADGFDAWFEPDVVSRELSVGAPPDLLNTGGQDWGLAGFNSAGLAAHSFAPFRDMVEASARYAGAIRLDHVMGLQRLFLVPRGFSPRDGAYVGMPLEALLAVVAMVSQERRCIVVGEDLGTVTEGFRDRLREWGVWSYLVMLFEREHDGRFKSPDHYTANALVTFNTHDLPSYAGWCTRHDLGVKRGVGIDPGERDDERERAIAALDRALSDSGSHESGFSAVAGYLSRTPSRILSLSLDDIAGVAEQINVPGTVSEHANWRRRLPVSIEEFCERFRAGGFEDVLAHRRN